MPSCSANRISASGRLVVSRAVNGWTKVSREDLPVLHQLLPDDLPHSLHADAEQLGDGGAFDTCLCCFLINLFNLRGS